MVFAFVQGKRRRQQLMPSGGQKTQTNSGDLPFASGGRSGGSSGEVFDDPQHFGARADFVVRARAFASNLGVGQQLPYVSAPDQHRLDALADWRFSGEK